MTVTIVGGWAGEALTLAAGLLEEPEVDYRADGAQWLRDKLGEFPWSMQQEIMASVVKYRRTAVRSCHGVGKSWFGGRVMTWWIDTATIPTDRFVISTAPSAAQVSAVLWRELARAHRKGRLPGRINSAGYPQWKLHDGPDGLVGYGRRPADYSDSAFQGIHAPEGVLIVVDEANGVPAHLFQQIDSIMSDVSSRLLLIGNPTDPNSYFARACSPSSEYNVIHIDALRSPNFNEEECRPFPFVRALMEAEGIPYSTEVVPPEVGKALVSPDWVESRIRDWAGVPLSLLEQPWHKVRSEVQKSCASSGVFMARVRAVFPSEDGDSVIPLGWIEQAMIRWEAWRDGVPLFDAEGRPRLDVEHGQWPMAPRMEQPGRRVIGVDVAREGNDRTVLAIRQGKVVEQLIVHVKQDTMQTADEVAAWLAWPRAQAVVDTIGVGGGVADRLRQLRVGNVVDFVASENHHRKDATGHWGFRNNRGAAWWNLRELLDPSRGHNIMLPRDDELMIELGTAKYKPLEGQPIYVIETKDEIKKRLGRSPDKADAVIQAFWTAGTAPSSGPDADKAIPYAEAAGEAIDYDLGLDADMYDTTDGWS